jgi:hypothetical protein
MTKLARGLAALALLTVGSAAFAFVRTTAGSGQVLWWRPRQIAFQVNASAFTGSGCDGASGAATAVRESFPAWMNAASAGQAVCTDFAFGDCGDTTRTDLGFDPGNRQNSVNLVVFRKGNCSAIGDSICHPADPNELGPCVEKYNCWEDGDPDHSADAIALTTVQFVVSTGEILDADMELNGWNGSLAASTGFYFTCASPGLGITVPCPSVGATDCIQFDVRNTVTHEAGHMLGLDHVCVTSTTPGPTCPAGGSVMEPNAREGEIDKRTLRADDVSGVCTIYPAGGPTPTSSGNVAASAPQACPSGANSDGCSSTGAGSLSLFGLGLALLGRRGRALAVVRTWEERPRSTQSSES